MQWQRKREREGGRDRERERKRKQRVSKVNRDVKKVIEGVKNIVAKWLYIIMSALE